MGLNPLASDLKTKIVIGKHRNTVSPHYSAIYFTFIHYNYFSQFLRNRETRWKYKTGFKIRNRELAIDTFDTSKTREEQQASIEKISPDSLLRLNQKKS